MILKDRPEDFRVVEQLNPKFLGEGPHTVYRVAKKKLTTLEAIGIIAKEAGIEKSDISFAGLKDRQGVTVQYVSMTGGRPVSIETPDLKVSLAGHSSQPVSSEFVEGNLFEIAARAVSQEEQDCLHQNFQDVRRFGLPNYFDDQRFGCIRHGQGFIVRDLLRGEVELGLKKLISAPSPFADGAEEGFKAALRSAWGDWDRCFAVTKGRQHETLFRHLQKHPNDFIGAFCFISSRIRLIHLYAYQSYLWNKSVSLYLREKLPGAHLLSVQTDIGPLLCPESIPPELEKSFRSETFPLLDPNTKLEDPLKRHAVDAVLKVEGLSLSHLQVQGIPGFVFKGEPRALMLCPSYIRVKPPEPDRRFRGKKMIGFRFVLPTGSYATLVVKRLFAKPEHMPKKGFRRERQP